jgi:hypothetical protein
MPFPNKNQTFKKGQTGNPNGRPKLPDLKEVMAKVLSEEVKGKSSLESILKAIKGKANKGDVRAAELLLKYTYSMPVQKHDVSTLGEKVNTTTVIVHNNDMAKKLQELEKQGLNEMK